MLSSGGDRWEPSRKLELKNQVLYELHIGTFAADGTYQAAESEFPRSTELGITALEIMPVNEFGGGFGWGYDGVNLFAPYYRYGAPDDFRHMIDAAHTARLAVFLDVVYNHLGPDGNYLAEFSKSFFSKTLTEWGEHLTLTEKTVSRCANFSFRTRNIGFAIFISMDCALTRPRVASIPAYMASRFSRLSRVGRGLRLLEPFFFLANASVNRVNS